MHLSTLTLLTLLFSLATAEITFKPQRQPSPVPLLPRQDQPSAFTPPTSVLTDVTPTTTTAQAPSTTILPSGTRTGSGTVEPNTSTGSLAASGAGGQTGAVQQPRSSGEVNAAAATATAGVRALGAALVGMGAAVAGVLV